MSDCKHNFVSVDIAVGGEIYEIKVCENCCFTADEIKARTLKDEIEQLEQTLEETDAQIMKLRQILEMVLTHCDFSFKRSVETEVRNALEGWRK